MLEVHEGWGHLGTTLNGGAQPACTFLGKGTPSATTTQEGLAVLTEILTLRSSPSRLYRLINRVRAITLEDIQTWRQLIDEGVVEAPRFVPPHFADLQGLATWMSFSRFIASLNFDQLQADYGALI